MAARVVFTSGFSRRYTGGVREFTVEAKNLHGVIKAMDRLYPGLGEHLEEETTSQSTAPSTKPSISSRSAKAAKSSSSPNSKGVTLAPSLARVFGPSAYYDGTQRSWRLCLS